MCYYVAKKKKGREEEEEEEEKSYIKAQSQNATQIASGHLQCVAQV